MRRLTCGFTAEQRWSNGGVVGRLGDWMGAGERGGGGLPSGCLRLEPLGQPAFYVLPAEHHAPAEAEAPGPGTEVSPVTERGNGGPEVGGGLVESQQAR